MKQSSRSPRHSFRPLPLSRSAWIVAALSATVATAGVFALAPAASANSVPHIPVDAAAKKRLYVIGYSHLDTQWCWTYPQVIREFIPNTLHENFSLFEKYPDYVFNWTGSNRYIFMKEYYPEDYAKLKHYVAAGKWFPAGSSVEEGDVNSPSEESLIRQVMYGNEYFRKEFGKASEEYMLPDCFGFPASLPSILAHCGLKGFSTQKLTWGSAVGIPFNVGRWIGPDNQSIVGALNAGDYGARIDDDLSNDPGWEARLAQDQQKDKVGVDYSYYGVGDRGGSPTEGSVINLEKSLHAGGPVQVIGGRADQMFLDLTPQDLAVLPTYKGDLELTQHSAGSLTSEATQKRWNHKNELLADAAERASVAADWLGAAKYDQARLTDGWLRFLPGQFHDLMAGTALPLAYTYTWNDEVIALNEFAGVLKESVGGVVRGLDTTSQQGGTAVVVYNPLSVDRNDVVDVTIPLDRNGGGFANAFGPKGDVSPVEFLSSLADGHHILFRAKVPANGFAVYHIVSAPGQTLDSHLQTTNRSIENQHYRVTVNDAGDVASIFDKVAQKELLSAPARLAYMHENPREYPAWNMDWTDQQKAPRAYVDGPAEIKVIEQGSIRVAIQITRESLGSKFVQIIRLDGTDSSRVEFETKIDWRGKGSALKAEFPLTVSNPTATYNWELGTVKRGNNNSKKYEVASHKWFDLTNPDSSYGVSVLSDSKYGSDKPNDNTLRLTLLYTPGVRGGYEHQATQDWGHQEMLYALSGHEGTWQNGQTQWQAQRLDQPLVAFAAPSHPGKLGPQFSLARVSTNQVSIEAMKKAENSDEIIVRLNELAGKDAQNVTVAFAGPILSAREVDGQERPVGPARVVNGRLVTDMTAYRPRAFALRLKGYASPLAAPKTTPLSLPFNLDGISTWAHKTDGNFDGTGKSLPGELLPATIVSNGIPFKLGSKATGAMNTLIAEGQTLALPPGTHRKLYFLAASVNGDTQAKFSFGSSSRTLKIQAWNGYIGQWDTRLWGGQVPELTYGWDNPLVGLVPGYVKRDQVAWYADHARLADGTNDIYAFCYLFRYSIDVPYLATSVKLPKNAAVRILAASVAINPNEDAVAVEPLYDTLAGHDNSAPVVTPVSGSFNDSVMVSIEPGRYWTPGDQLHYTLDGSAPTAESPVYTEPFSLAHAAHVRAVSITKGGASGPSVDTMVDVNDSTPPSIVSTTSMRGSKEVEITFSEPVDIATANNVKNYKIDPFYQVLSAKLDSSGRRVDLQLEGAMTSNTPPTVIVNGVKDLSPSGNATVNAGAALKILTPVILMNSLEPLNGKKSVSLPADGLPTGATAPWTINMFVRMEKQPEELTIIGGFGDARDSHGAERFLIKFHDSIQFWGSNVDVATGVPFDIAKWQMITMTFDGKELTIYKDGIRLKKQAITLSDAQALIQLAPQGPWSEGGTKFAGKIKDFSVWNEALPASYVHALLSAMPSP